jgi:hypothetical protein
MNVDHVDALRQFRYDVYERFQRSRDTLFNTVDALMTETQAKSFPLQQTKPICRIFCSYADNTYLLMK